MARPHAARGPKASFPRQASDPEEHLQFQLRLKGTFIEVASSNSREASLSPRASSEPGSERDQSFYFGREARYVNDLAEQLSQTWRNGSHSMVSGARGSADYISLSDNLSSASGEPPDARLSPRGESFSFVPKNTPLTGRIESAPVHGGTHPSEMDRKELRSHIKHATKEMEKDIHARRYRAVLSAIQEIPEQVGDALQKSAISIVDDVMGEVAVVRDIIQGNCPPEGQTHIDKVVEKLEVIPEMIQDSFEAYFAQAERTVRWHVDNMIQGFEDRELGQEQVVKEMRLIPCEVQEITEEAMQAAVQESRAQAQEQINSAIRSLPESDALQRAEEWMVVQVPDISANLVQAAKNAASGSVEHAVATVHADEDMPKVSNQVVAETLLRAKVGEKPKGTWLDLHQWPPPVPDVGDQSYGHPELCARPCLYYARGECANGQNCNFCHLPHPRRPVHPDKKNRQLLKEMQFEECVAVMFPVLREKVASLGLGPGASRMLNSLRTALEGGSQQPPAEPMLAGRRKKQLQDFLRSMSLRSVLAQLMRGAPEPWQREAVETLTAGLRAEADRVGGLNRPIMQGSDPGG
mmetsp:Transcript_76149/g.246614  ORF Transcript_76149/g.246614 Transcript_76149/m.246614 type:complete len:580 (-) Transcript_76149:150-1889(-)